MEIVILIGMGVAGFLIMKKGKNKKDSSLPAPTKPVFYCKECGKESSTLKELCYGPNNCKFVHHHEVFEGK